MPRQFAIRVDPTCELILTLCVSKGMENLHTRTSGILVCVGVGGFLTYKLLVRLWDAEFTAFLINRWLKQTCERNANNAGIGLEHSWLQQHCTCDDESDEEEKNALSICCSNSTMSTVMDEVGDGTFHCSNKQKHDAMCSPQLSSNTSPRRKRQLSAVLPPVYYDVRSGTYLAHKQTKRSADAVDSVRIRLLPCLDKQASVEVPTFNQDCCGAIQNRNSTVAAAQQIYKTNVTTDSVGQASDSLASSHSGESVKLRRNRRPETLRVQQDTPPDSSDPRSAFATFDANPFSPFSIDLHQELYAWDTASGLGTPSVGAFDAETLLELETCFGSLQAPRTSDEPFAPGSIDISSVLRIVESSAATRTHASSSAYYEFDDLHPLRQQQRRDEIAGDCTESSRFPESDAQSEFSVNGEQLVSDSCSAANFAKLKDDLKQLKADVKEGLRMMSSFQKSKCCVRDSRRFYRSVVIGTESEVASSTDESPSSKILAASECSSSVDDNSLHLKSSGSHNNNSRAMLPCVSSPLSACNSSRSLSPAVLLRDKQTTSSAKFRRINLRPSVKPDFANDLLEEVPPKEHGIMHRAVVLKAAAKRQRLPQTMASAVDNNAVCGSAAFSGTSRPLASDLIVLMKGTSSVDTPSFASKDALCDSGFGIASSLMSSTDSIGSSSNLFPILSPESAVENSNMLNNNIGDSLSAAASVHVCTRLPTLHEELSCQDSRSFGLGVSENARAVAATYRSRRTSLSSSIMDSDVASLEWFDDVHQEDSSGTGHDDLLNESTEVLSHMLNDFEIDVAPPGQRFEQCRSTKATSERRPARKPSLLAEAVASDAGGATDLLANQECNYGRRSNFQSIYPQPKAVLSMACFLEEFAPNDYLAELTMRQLQEKRGYGEVRLFESPRSTDDALIEAVLHGVWSRNGSVFRCHQFEIVAEALELCYKRCPYLSAWRFPLLRQTASSNDTLATMKQCLRVLWDENSSHCLHEQSAEVESVALRLCPNGSALIEAVKLLLLLRAIDAFEFTVFMRKSPEQFYDELFRQFSLDRLSETLSGLCWINKFNELFVALLADALGIRLELVRLFSSRAGAGPNVIAVYPSQAKSSSSLPQTDNSALTLTCLLPKESFDTVGLSA